MTFEHCCFISFRNGKQPLMKGFINQLHQALASELEPLFDFEKRICIDFDYLEAGDVYAKRLASGLCKSVCMILVYNPTYFSISHTWCAREYRAMVQLEEERFQSFRLLNPSHNIEDHGLIIPIIFRAPNGRELPKELRERRHYYDFRKFSITENNTITINNEFNDEIRKIVDYIYERYNELKQVAHQLNNCAQFTLPNDKDQEFQQWIKTVIDDDIQPFPFSPSQE